MLSCSGRVRHLVRYFRLVGVVPFTMYGDSAYPGSIVLMKPFPDRCEFNRVMSTVRESVEWGFKEIVNYWPLVDYKKKLQLLKTNIGKRIVLAVLLTNARCMLHGNQISNYFECYDRPSLEAYFGHARNIR